MRKYWEFTQKNVFSKLLSLLGQMTHENLTCQIEYLKVENEILRKRVGKPIRPTAIERRMLLKFGAPLGKDIKNIISIDSRKDTLYRHTCHQCSHRVQNSTTSQRNPLG